LILSVVGLTVRGVNQSDSPEGGLVAEVAQIEGSPIRAVLNGWERLPWEMNGKSGTYLQLSVTREGSLDSERITCVREVEESKLPANGSMVELLPVFEKVFQKSVYKMKVREVRALKGANA
jgi:hypothetical protein